MVLESCASEDTKVMYDFIEGETFKMFINRIGLQMSDLGDCFINGTLAKENTPLSDNDRVALFPFNMVLLCGGQHLKGHGYTQKDKKVDYY